MKSCIRTKHVTRFLLDVSQRPIHCTALNVRHSGWNENSKLNLGYFSKRFYNDRNHFRLTRKQRKERKEHEKRFQNSIHEDSNYFEDIDVDTQTIPNAMKPPPSNSKTPHKPLKLDDIHWKDWDSVEQRLNLQSLRDEIETNVHQIVNGFGHKLRFANPSDKSKVLPHVLSNQMCRLLNLLTGLVN